MSQPEISKPRVGDTIVHEAPTFRDSEFIVRHTGVVAWIDRSLATPDGLLMAEIKSKYVYHPIAPEEGRLLPHDEFEICNVDECVVIAR